MWVNDTTLYCSRKYIHLDLKLVVLCQSELRNAHSYETSFTKSKHNVMRAVLRTLFSTLILWLGKINVGPTLWKCVPHKVVGHMWIPPNKRMGVKECWKGVFICACMCSYMCSFMYFIHHYLLFFLSKLKLTAFSFLKVKTYACSCVSCKTIL